MVKERTKYPIESFGPEIMAALLRGSRERVDIPLETYRKGAGLQRRIHHLRKLMRDQNHPQANIVSRTRTSLLWGRRAGYEDVEEKINSNGVHYPTDRSCPVILRLAPFDSEFTDALTKAGISLPEIGEPPTAPPAQEEVDDYLEDILRNTPPTRENM
jgi:hypothetical protein